MIPLVIVILMLHVYNGRYCLVLVAVMGGGGVLSSLANFYTYDWMFHTVLEVTLTRSLHATKSLYNYDKKVHLEFDNT